MKHDDIIDYYRIHGFWKEKAFLVDSRPAVQHNREATRHRPLDYVVVVVAAPTGARRRVRH
jgi:hypothetical protein